MRNIWKQAAWVTAYAVAFGYLEASVVVYLRGLFYPDGFLFPLKVLNQSTILVEVGREFSTIVMLTAAAFLAGRTKWTRFGYFLIAFGVWDIFYYVWLKVLLNWPLSILDWDVLFLIPVPWIGPVLAPLVVSVLMIASGMLLLRTEDRGRAVRVSAAAWACGAVGSVLILYTFLRDTATTLRAQEPEPFEYGIFVAGFLLLLSAMALTFARKRATP